MVFRMYLVRFRVEIRMSWLLVVFLSLSTSLPGQYLECFTTSPFKPFPFGHSSYTPTLCTLLCRCLLYRLRFNVTKMCGMRRYESTFCSFRSVSRFWIWFCNSLQIAFSVSCCFRSWTAMLTLRSSFLMPYCDTFTEDDGVLKLPPVWHTVRKKIAALTIRFENCCWKNS